MQTVVGGEEGSGKVRAEEGRGDGEQAAAVGFGGLEGEVDGGWKENEVSIHHRHGKRVLGVHTHQTLIRDTQIMFAR